MKLPRVPHLGLIAGGIGALALVWLYVKQQQTAAVATAAGQAATGQPNYPLFQSAALPAGNAGAGGGSATGSTAPASGLTSSGVADLFKTLLTAQGKSDATNAVTTNNQLSSSVGDHLFSQLNAIDGTGILGGGSISGNLTVNQGVTSFSYNVAPRIVTPPTPVAPVNPAPTTVVHPYAGYVDNVTGTAIAAAQAANDPVLAMMGGAVSNTVFTPVVFGA